MKIELDINDLEGLNDSVLEKLEDLSDSDFNALIVEALKQKFVNTSLEDIINGFEIMRDKREDYIKILAVMD